MRSRPNITAYWHRPHWRTGVLTDWLTDWLTGHNSLSEHSQSFPWVARTAYLPCLVLTASHLSDPPTSHLPPHNVVNWRITKSQSGASLRPTKYYYCSVIVSGDNHLTGGYIITQPVELEVLRRPGQTSPHLTSTKLSLRSSVITDHTICVSFPGFYGQRTKAGSQKTQKGKNWKSKNLYLIVWEAP